MVGLDARHAARTLVRARPPSTWMAATQSLFRRSRHHPLPACIDTAESTSHWRKTMASYVGLWIDHREAVIVSLTGEVDKTMRVISDMEKHVRFSGGAQKASSEDRRDRRFEGHLNEYYDKVVSCIRNADSILILVLARQRGKSRHVSTANPSGDSSLVSNGRQDDGSSDCRQGPAALHPLAFVDAFCLTEALHNNSPPCGFSRVQISSIHHLHSALL